MNTSTPMKATIEAILPASIESAPSSGPIVCFCRNSMSAGKAPARNRTARLVLSSMVNEPEMIPEPPGIGSLIRGALITSPSSTMAKGEPTFSAV